MIGIGLGVGLQRLGDGGAAPPSFDADAQAYFDRVTTAGGTLSTTEKNAVNQLVLDLKANSLWTPMKAIYPMVGSSAAACAQNLKSSSFTGTFTSGWTFASTGVTPNGTSAYMDTGFAPSSNLTSNNASIGYYGGTSGTSLKCAMGAAGGGSYFQIYPAYPAYGLFGDIFDAGNVFTTNLSADGFIFAYRNSSSTQKKHSIRGTITTKTESTSAGTISSNLVLGARNNNGSFQEYSNLQHRFAFIGDGLTDTQASNFYTAVQTFNQTLNRQVGAQIVSDADAQAYINRVYTAGGTLTNTEANAVNQLVIDMKASNVWTSMKAVYPMVGASAAACAQNLKSSSFTGTFTSGWTYASTGVTPNGTSAYMNTSLTPSTALSSINNVHLSMYSRTQNSSVSGHNMGVDTTAENLNLAQYYSAVSVKLFMNGAYPTNSAEFNQTNTKGLAIGSATTSTSRKLYFNGSLLNTDTNTQSTTSPTNTLLIGCGRNASAGSVPAYFTPHENSFASIGDGLTDTQAAALYTNVQTFQVALTRSV